MVHMNYILSYNYSNLNTAEYSGTHITYISDDVLSAAGIINLQFGDSTRT